jgi:hypothetical protein
MIDLKIIVSRCEVSGKTRYDRTKNLRKHVLDKLSYLHDKRIRSLFEKTGEKTDYSAFEKLLEIAYNCLEKDIDEGYDVRFASRFNILADVFLSIFKEERIVFDFSQLLDDLSWDAVYSFPSIRDSSQLGIFHIIYLGK